MRQTRIKSKVLAVALSFLMALTMMPCWAIMTAGEVSADASENAEYVAQVGDTGYQTLQAACDAAKDNDIITLLASSFGDNEYAALTKLNGKNVTVIGGGMDKTEIKITCSGHITGSSTVIFKDMTLAFAGNTDSYTSSLSGKFENVKIKGQITTVYGISTFKNCIFDPNGVNYSLWVYSDNVELNNCKFLHGSEKAHVKLYAETGNKISANFNGCTFNGEPSKKCNILVSNLNNNNSTRPNSLGSKKSYSVSIADCTSPYNIVYDIEKKGSIVGQDEDCPALDSNIPAIVTFNGTQVFPENQSKVVVEPVEEDVFNDSNLGDTEKTEIINKLTDNIAITAEAATNIEQIEGVSTLAIKLESIVAEKTDNQVKVNSITYDVTPKNEDNEAVSTPGEKIKFRLPLTDDFTTYAKIEHENDEVRYAQVKGEEGEKYCEVEADHFSLFTATPVDEVPVAKVGDTQYITMSEAAEAWASSGGTLKLLTNVEYGTRINLKDKTDFVLDLNGFTYNAGSGNSPIDVYSSLKIMDSSTNKTGKIVCDFDSNEWVFVVFVENNATLNVESGKILGKNGASNDKSGCIFGATDHSTINVSGGEIIDQTTGANDNRWAVEMNGSGTISGGKIDGAVWLASGGTVTNGKFKGRVYSDGATIGGGYYSENLAKGSVAAGFKWTNNAEDDSATYPYKVVPATVTELAGSGTKDDPYLIKNKDELEFFRDDVNQGNTYSGKYVNLKANIDLANELWTPIGVNGSNGNKAFCGTFDGESHTISNLKVDISSGIAGLFGSTGYSEVTTTIKNLNLTNVDVKGVSNVGGVVGWITGTAAFDNIHVNGNVKIEATVADVGGIVGHSVGVLTANNCSVLATGESGSYIKACTSGGSAACGGIVGFAGNEASGRTDSITNCSVSNIELTSYNRIGGIVGMMQDDDKYYKNNNIVVSDNSVHNIKVNVHGPTAAKLNDRHDAQAGLIVGSTTTNGNRQEHHYANNTYYGNCVLTAVTTHATDIIPTQLYGLWTLGAQRVKDVGQTGSSWYTTNGNADVTYASAEETGEVLFDGTYYMTFLKAYNTDGIGATGSSEDKPFKLMTDVGYSLVVGDKIYVEGDGHIFYPRTDEDGYRVKTTTISDTVKLYELEADPDTTFVASLSVNDKEVKKFTTINKAFAAAPKDNTSCTITVLNDCTMSTNYTIPSGCDITLELNGKTVEMKDVAKLAMFYVQGQLTVQDNTDTLKNGTGTGKLWSHSDTVAMYGLATQNGTINFNSGLLHVEANSSTLTEQIQALYIGGNRNGIINANGGKVKASVVNTANESAYVFYGSGNSTAGAKFNLNGSIFEGNSAKSYIIGDNTPYGNTTLKLIQGTLISPNKDVDKYGDKTSSGGSFVSCPITNILAEGSVIDKPDSVTRVIRKANYVAQIDDTKYETLASAFVAINDGTKTGTIKLLANIDGENVSLAEGKAATLDLNGCIWTSKNEYPNKHLVINENATMTITDTNTDITHKFVPDANGLWKLNDEATGTEGTDYYVVTGGAITGGSCSDGGAIDVYGTLNLNAGNIVGNTASVRGGAICVGHNDGTKPGVLNISGGTVNGNTSVTSGAIHVYAGSFNMTNGEVSYNTATKNNGAISLAGGDNVHTISGGSISHNTAKDGDCGAISSGGTLTISGSTVMEYNATVGGTERGGAIYNPSGNTLNILGGKFSFNSAPKGGGAVCNNGIFNLSGGEISYNSGDNGGAVYTTNTGSMTMTGGSIRYNKTIETAGAYCGGIDNGGVLTIKGGTIANNTASGIGGGIWSSGVVNIEGGIIKDNVANGTADTKNGGANIFINDGGTGAGNTKLNITGGEISGGSIAEGGEGTAIYVRTENGAPQINISGTSTKIDGSVYLGTKKNNGFAEGSGITGGKFSGKITSGDTNVVKLISGGIFTDGSAATTETDLIAEGKSFVENTDDMTKVDYPWTIGDTETNKLLTYSVDNASNWGIGTLSGGGDVTAGSVVNLHASSVEGHKFVMWAVAASDYEPYSSYDESKLTQVSTEQNYTWTVPADVQKDSNGNIRIIAVYEAIRTEATVTASAVDAKGDPITGITITGDIGEKNIGNNKTITAPETTGSGESELKFRYWTNEKGNILAKKNSYTFDLFADINVKAVYTSSDENAVLVAFESETHQLLRADTYTITQQSVTEINDAVPPSKLGYSFTNWTLDGTTAVTYENLKKAAAERGNDMVSVMPLYTLGENKYDVTVEMYILAEDGGYKLVKTEKVIDQFNVGDACEITASSTCEYNGITYNFNRFTTDEDENALTLSTSRTMTLRPTSSKTVRAVYETAARTEEVSVVTTDCGKEDEIDFKDNSNVYKKVFFTMSYIVPDNYEFVEAGILYSTNRSKVEGEKPSGTLLMPSSGKDNKGNFTLHIDVTEYLDTMVYARGYVKYKSGDETITKYADNILSRSYSQQTVD